METYIYISTEQYAEKVNISSKELWEKSKKRHISLLRQIYWYHLSITGMKLINIAYLFNRKHSTVFYGINRIKGFIQIKEKSISQYLEAINIFSH